MILTNQSSLFSDSFNWLKIFIALETPPLRCHPTSSILIRTTMPKKNHVASSRPAAPLSPPKAACYDPAAAGSTSGGGSALRGVDLAEQVAQSSKIQKQRWLECGLTASRAL